MGLEFEFHRLDHHHCRIGVRLVLDPLATSPMSSQMAKIQDGTGTRSLVSISTREEIFGTEERGDLPAKT
jgi:hypothetical protein